MEVLWLAADSVIDGTYRVVRPLGRGAMGEVVLAWDERLERLVAIKLIRPRLLDSPALRERFVAEARAMARVNHPNVLQVHAFGEHQSAPYFVMEYVEGETAEEWLTSRPGVLPDRQIALRVLDEACRGAAAIHAAHTVHRDLKPGNILLDKDLRARVADLGLANVLHHAVPRNDGGSDAEIVGTPAYMAPEVTLQSDVPAGMAHRADVYALGCIAFELLTGRLPFEAVGDLALMVKHTTHMPPAPSSLCPGLPSSFDAPILGALRKDPRERTPSAEVFRRGLAAAAEGTREPVRILVAEDDEDFRDALGIALTNEFPCAVIECVGDGAAALDAFDRMPHSVAIIDLQMPHLDGLELTGLLRARAASKAMPIIVLTASGGPQEWKRLSAMGADGFLVKPVNLKDVATLVRRTLRERSA